MEPELAVEHRRSATAVEHRRCGTEAAQFEGIRFGLVDTDEAPDLEGLDLGVGIVSEQNSRKS